MMKMKSKENGWEALKEGERAQEDGRFMGLAYDVLC